MTPGSVTVPFRTALAATAFACLLPPDAGAATCEVVPALKNATITVPYTGDCRNGLAHGKGKYTLASGTTAETSREYSGEFSDGKLHGRASIVITSPRGITRAEANFANNELHGAYRVVMPDGRVASAEYKAGKIWRGVNLGVRGGVPFAARWLNGRQVTLCLGDRSNELNCTPTERAVLLEGAAPPLDLLASLGSSNQSRPDAEEVNPVAKTAYGKSFPAIGGARLGDGPRAAGKLAGELQRQGYTVYPGSMTLRSFPELLSGGFLAVNKKQVVMAIPSTRTKRIALIKRSEAWDPDNLPLEEVFLGAIRDTFLNAAIVENYSNRLVKGALEWGVTKNGRAVPGDDCFRENIKEVGFAGAAFGKLVGADEFPRTGSDFVGLHPISAKLDADGMPFCALYIHVQVFSRENPLVKQLERYDMSVTDVASLYEDHLALEKAQRALAEKERQRILQNSPRPKF